MAESTRKTGTIELPVHGSDPSAQNAELATAIGNVTFKILSVKRTGSGASEKWVIEFEYSPKS